MLRSVRFVVAAILAIALVAAVAAGCGSSSSSDSSSASPAASAAVDKTKAFKVGISQIVTHPALDATVQGIQDELTAQGFTGIEYDLQNAEGDMATTASIAQKFAGDNLDLAIGVATPTSQALAKAITDKPVLFTAVTDPVGAGLVQDPTAPSGNVTGVSDMQPVKPILELVKTFRPDAKAVGMVYNAGESNSVYLVTQAEKEAAGHGPHHRQGAGEHLRRGRSRPPSRSSAAPRPSWSSATTRPCRRSSPSSRWLSRTRCRSWPATPTASSVAPSPAYGFDYYDLGKQTGAMAAKVLSGTPVADIPVEFAANLQLSINEKAAAAQGVTIPQDLIDQAVNKY